MRAPGVKLFFSSESDPELYRVQVEHPRLRAPKLSVRGKSAGAHRGAGSFQWTAAVRALAILLVRSAGHIARAEHPLPLVGEAGTPASSLDYALAKNTQWVTDMFACDDSEHPLWPSFFHRSNPNRKHDAPAAVSLRSAICVESSLVVEWNGRELQDSSELFQLASVLEASWFKKNAKPQSPPESLLGQTLLAQLRSAIESEVAEALRRTDIFSPQALRSSLRSISKSAGFSGIAGERCDLLAASDLGLGARKRLGMALPPPPAGLGASLSVAVPAPVPASHALFAHLNLVSRINFAIDSSHVHAVELARETIAGTSRNQCFDLLCLGVAPAATLLADRRGRDYEPLMLLPRISKRIVSSASSAKRDLNFGRYMLIKDEPSIPSFVMDELLSLGAMNTSRVSMVHREPDEVFSEFAKGEEDTRALLFFPHYNFNQWLNGCSFLSDPRSTESNQECLLFAHKRLLAKKGFAEWLCASVRFAWMELRSSPKTLSTTIDSMNQRDRYSRRLARCGGLHHLLPESAI